MKCTYTSPTSCLNKLIKDNVRGQYCYCHLTYIVIANNIDILNKLGIEKVVT
jgi:hypothetical protein